MHIILGLVGIIALTLVGGFAWDQSTQTADLQRSLIGHQVERQAWDNILAVSETAEVVKGDTTLTFASPTGENLPASTQAVTTDKYGSAFIYCVRSSVLPTDPTIAILSPGEDGVAQTDCTDVWSGTLGDDTAATMTSRQFQAYAMVDGTRKITSYDFHEENCNLDDHVLQKNGTAWTCRSHCNLKQEFETRYSYKPGEPCVES